MHSTTPKNYADTHHCLQPIAQNALTILINISSDKEVLKLLADDDAFLETMLLRMTVCQSTFSSPSPNHHIPPAVI